MGYSERFESASIRLFRLSFFATLTLICALFAAGCGGGGNAPSQADVSGPGLELGSPLSMLQTVLAARGTSYERRDLFKQGYEYETVLPQQNVNTDGGKVSFSPDWTPGGGLTGAAYCIYYFHAPDYDLAANVLTNWQQPPADPSTFFFALANWEQNHWTWFTSDGGGNLTAQDFAPYFTDEGDMLLVVASIGEGTCEMDSLRLGASPTGGWVSSWGGPGWESFNGMALDDSGDLYMVGSTDGWYENNGIGTAKCLLVKFSPQGDCIWARTWNYATSGRLPDAIGLPRGSGDAYASVAVGPDGKVYVCGCSFDIDMLIQKWTSDGELVWSKLCGGDGSDDYPGTIVATDEAVYIAGQTRPPVDDGSWPRVAYLKFSLDGDMLLAKNFGQQYSDLDPIFCPYSPGPGQYEFQTVFQPGQPDPYYDGPAFMVLDSDLNVMQGWRWESAPHGVWVQNLTIVSDPEYRSFLAGSFIDRTNPGAARLSLCLLETPLVEDPVAKFYGNPYSSETNPVFVHSLINLPDQKLGILAEDPYHVDIHMCFVKVELDGTLDSLLADTGLPDDPNNVMYFLGQIGGNYVLKGRTTGVQPHFSWVPEQFSGTADLPGSWIPYSPEITDLDFSVVSLTDGVQVITDWVQDSTTSGLDGLFGMAVYDPETGELSDGS